MCTLVTVCRGEAHNAMVEKPSDGTGMEAVVQRTSSHGIADVVDASCIDGNGEAKVACWAGDMAS